MLLLTRSICFENVQIKSIFTNSDGCISRFIIGMCIQLLFPEPLSVPITISDASMMTETMNIGRAKRDIIAS